MINDDVAHVRHADGIRLARHRGLIAGPAAQVADDDVMGVRYDDSISLDADAIARRTLSRDGQEGLLDRDRPQQFNGAGNLEDNGSWVLCLSGGSQAARPAVMKIRYRDHCAAAPAF
jgi:hypothetical protein